MILQMRSNGGTKRSRLQDRTPKQKIKHAPTLASLLFSRITQHLPPQVCWTYPQHSATRPHQVRWSCPPRPRWFTPPGEYS
jgi:hypothetical protein